VSLIDTAPTENRSVGKKGDHEIAAGDPGRERWKTLRGPRGGTQLGVGALERLLLRWFSINLGAQKR